MNEAAFISPAQPIVSLNCARKRHDICRGDFGSPLRHCRCLCHFPSKTQQQIERVNSLVARYRKEGRI